MPENKHHLRKFIMTMPMPLKAERTGTDFHPPLLSNPKSTPFHKHMTVFPLFALYFFLSVTFHNSDYIKNDITVIHEFTVLWAKPLEEEM